MSLIKTTLIVAVLFASHLAVISFSVQASSRSLAGCGYTTMTGTETLYYGRDQQVGGTVNWQLSDDGISVTYNVNPGCTAGTAHVELSDTVLSSPIPGMFDCNQQGSGSTFTVVCGNENLSDLSCCSTKYLYTHLELTCGDEDETAFSGDNKCTGNRWCNYVSIPPPCDDCKCDTANNKCFQKKSCGVFPKTCTTTPVCEEKLGTCVTPTSCTDPNTCTPLICPDPVYPGVPTECKGPEFDCSTQVGPFCNTELVCDISKCVGPKFDCSKEEETFCNDNLVCDKSDCEVPDYTCPSDKCPSNGKVCKASQCMDPEKCESDKCDEGKEVCSQDECTLPSDCKLADCPGVGACPGEKCECPGECPNCFVPDIVNGERTCVPDQSENDLCNPCKKGAKLCQSIGKLSNEYKCCPPNSECKKDTVTSRLGVGQGDRDVSFICSSQCGLGCDESESSIPDQSRACSLFQPLDLKNDGDPLTDDIFNTCPTLTMDTSTTLP